MIKYILGKSLSIAINIASSHFENILQYTLFQDNEKRRRFISSILFVSHITRFGIWCDSKKTLKI